MVHRENYPQAEIVDLNAYTELLRSEATRKMQKLRDVTAARTISEPATLAGRGRGRGRGRGMPPPNGPGTFIDEDTGVSILHPGSKAATLLFGPYGSSHSQVQPQRPVKLDTRRPQQRKGKEVVTTSQLQK
ncbi:uncharacterized protein LOC126672879 isoform X1 [Mercurialis annua]|uniref:uncharacterized protein LOC126672879 isoform X1 n=1 Tax=Mercurialis annua TaxID=3986 RepID=UPI00215F26D7|nr:uncharacterized protein LOC126672879 isoform X1 [Mercurialis annua]XP_050222795.1 uncharacterized protein LOC126672879 isoform X1 [Mercurialis annua]